MAEIAKGCPTCACRIRTLNGLYCQRLKHLVQWNGQRPQECLDWEAQLIGQRFKPNR